MPHISPIVTQDIRNYEDTDIQSCDSASNVDTMSMSISSTTECKKIALDLEKKRFEFQFKLAARSQKNVLNLSNPGSSISRHTKKSDRLCSLPG